MDQAAEPRIESRTGLVVEVALVVLLFCLLPAWTSLGRILAPVHRAAPGTWQTSNFLFYAVGDLLYTLPRIAVLLYIIAGSKEGWAHFGFDRPCLRHVWQALVVFAVALAVRAAVQHVLPSVDTPLATVRNLSTYSVVTRAWDVAIHYPLRAMWTGFLQGAYLITRFVDLWRVKWIAVAVVVLIGVSWQMDGGANAIASGVLVGGVFAASFVWCKSVWPIVYARAAYAVAMWFYFVYLARV